MNKRLIGLALSLIMILTAGCSSIPMPGATMKPPSAPEAKNGELQDYKQVVADYLPAGAKLEDVNNTSVYPVDVDGDSAFEYLATYRLDESRVGAFLLKKSGSDYKIVWTDVGKGYGFDTVKIADVTGDGLNDILIGWTIGASAGNALDVLSWRNNTLQNIYRTSYHRIDVQDMEGYYGKDDVAEIALWTKDTGEAYDVQVMRWNERDKDFESAPDVYQAYYPGVVQKVKAASDARFYWYYLGIAQYRAGQYEDALDSVASGEKLPGGYPGDAEFSLLKADILRDTDKLEQASHIYDGLLSADKPADTASPVRITAMAYFGKGEICRIKGDYDTAEEYYKKAQSKSMEIEFRRAINRLPVYKTVDTVENYFKNLNSGNFNGEKFVEWARENNITLSYKDVKTNVNGIRRVVFVDYLSEDLMKAHEVFWWDRGTLKKQLAFSNEFSPEDVFTLAVQDCRIVRGSDNSTEAGVVVETSYLGKTAPSPYYGLLRLTDDHWKLVWRPPVYKWRNSHATVKISGSGLKELILKGDSARTNDGKNRIFNEKGGAPRRHFEDIWQRDGDSYKLTDYESIPSAYNTLVEFIYSLSTDDEAAAKDLVADTALIEKAKQLKLIQPDLSGRWMLKTADADAETEGPFTITGGPADGITFTFEQQGQKWLIKDIIKK